jgi:LysM repeat protein
VKNSKLLLYACAGSLVTVLIWSFVGGYQTTSNKEMEMAPEVEVSSPEVVSEAVAEARETEEIMIKEGIIEEKTVAISEESNPPVKEVAPVPVAAKGEIVHVIDKGDTLWAISRTYGVPVNAIQEANGIEDAGSLSIGQKLKIPGA